MRLHKKQEGRGSLVKLWTTQFIVVLPFLCVPALAKAEGTLKKSETGIVDGICDWGL